MSPSLLACSFRLFSLLDFCETLLTLFCGLCPVFGMFCRSWFVSKVFLQPLLSLVLAILHVFGLSGFAFFCVLLEGFVFDQLSASSLSCLLVCFNGF